MTYYACIGFPVRSARDLRNLEEEAAQAGEAVVCGPGLGLRRWTLEHGVELWVELGPSGEVLGVLPFYDSGRDHDLAVVACDSDPDYPEEGWIEAWINPRDPLEPLSGDFPLVCDLVDYLARYPMLETLPRTVRARIAVLLHEATLFEDERALAEGPLRLPPRAFTSTSHFSVDGYARSDRPEATALLSGRIQRVDQFLNSRTGHPFCTLLVEVGNTALDLAAPVELLPGARPGMFLRAAGWVLAKIPAPGYPPNIADSSARR